MSFDHNTQRIYRLMEGLEISMKEIAADWNMSEEDTQEIIENGMPHEETQELIDRILCIHIEQERKLVCYDEELHDELMEYLMEQASEEIRHRLGWYYDSMIVDEMERLEHEARQVAKKAKEICGDLQNLQRVFWKQRGGQGNGTV